MKRRIVFLAVAVFVAAGMFGQDVAPTPTPARKRGWLSRILHPFLQTSSRNTKIRGCVDSLSIYKSRRKP